MTAFFPLGSEKESMGDLEFDEGMDHVGLAGCTESLIRFCQVHFQLSYYRNILSTVINETQGIQFEPYFGSVLYILV